MFLDLTMPVLDGCQVLERIKQEDLNAFVIVVSADIQPKAVERVISLGAVAFIKKPINSGEVTRVLQEFGIL